MRRSALSVAVAAVLTAGILPAHAQEQSGAAPEVWHLDWIRSHCTISTGDPSTGALSLWMTPGDPEPDLFVIGTPKLLRRSRDAKITVTLLPGNETFPAEVQEMSETSVAQLLRLHELGDKFPAAFSSASEVRLTGFKEPLRIGVRGADQAMDAVRQCIDQKLPQWGIDAKAYEGLRSPPTELHGYQWIGDENYPDSLRSRGQGGEVVARVIVDTSGKVTQCAVVVSSGLDALDAVTCRRALAAGRFNPAIGADGQPEAAARTVHLVFQLR